MNYQILCILLSNPSVDVKDAQSVIELANRYSALLDASRKAEDEKRNNECRQEQIKNQQKRIEELSAENHRLRVDLYAATNGPALKKSNKKI